MKVDRTLFGAILDRMDEGVYAVDAAYRIVLWNAAAERITGYPASEILGRSCTEGLLLHLTADGRRLCEQLCPSVAVLADGQDRTAKAFLHHKDGHSIPVTMRGSALRDERGEVIGAVEFFRPLPAARPAQPERGDGAGDGDIDPLTELGNRRYLHRHIAPAVVDEDLGVLFIDVDRFKAVNDTYGHAVGDRVLRVVGQTLAHGLRQSDWALRWGGEEFLAIVHTRQLEELQEVAERLRTLVARSWVEVGEDHVAVTVSIGATLRAPGQALESVIDRADQLMYASKQAGRDRVTVEPARRIIDLTTQDA